jgi:hypothetical protein
MNCHSVRDQIVGHWDQLQSVPLDGLTTPASADHGLQEHLQQCGACRQLAAEYSLSHQLLQGLPEVEPAENFEWRLRLRLNQIDKEGFVDETAMTPAVRRWRSLQFVGSAAAAAVVVLSVGFLALRAPGVRLPQGTATVQDVAQESSAVPASAERTRVDGSDAVATPAQLRWALDRDRPGLPNLAPTRPAYLRVVPVSAGVPFGPEATTAPAPSILGAELPLAVPFRR